MKTKYGIHLIYIALAIITFAVYEPVLHNGFISFDDDSYIYANPHITSGLNIKNIVWAFTNIHSNNYHPLTSISHMLDCQFFGLNPPRHHSINLIFHIANTALLFFVLSRMTNRVWPSAFVAALFALHPMHVESVAWASERKDVLSTFFWLLTMFAYWRYVQQSGKGRFILTLVLFTFGLLSKPMLVTLPCILLLLDYWPLDRLKNIKFKQLVIEKIPFFVLSAILCIITLAVQGKMGMVKDISRFPLAWRVENAVASYVIYIGKMFWPFNLAIFYTHPLNTVPLWRTLAALGLLVIVTIFVICKIRSKPYLAIGWFWFLGTLVPVIGLFQVGLQAYADRYTYIPYIGLFIIITWLVCDVADNLPKKKTILSITAALVLFAIGVKTYAQTMFWNNDFLLYSHAVNVTENNWWAHHFLGRAMAEHGDYENAVAQLEKSVEIYPDNAEALYILAQTYIMTGDVNDAQVIYNKMLSPQQVQDANLQKNISVSPTDYQRVKELYVSSTINLANILAQKGHLDEAEKWFKDALRVLPDCKAAKDGLEQIKKMREKQIEDSNTLTRK